MCGGHYEMAHCEAPEPAVWPKPAECAAALSGAGR